MAMNDITRIKIIKITESMEEILAYLYSRWVDEKEYEDFNDYTAKMKTNFDAAIVVNDANNAVFVKAQKRPFGFCFDFEGWQVVISITTKTLKWKAKLLN